MKQRLLCLALILLLLQGFHGTCAAEKMITITNQPITVTYNGEKIPFPDAAPLMQNGRTLVPMRAIMEHADLTVVFDADNQTVKADKETLSIQMQLNSKTADVWRGKEKETVTLEEPARLIDGRTYVPVRFIAESLGTKVNWNPYGREVVIIDTDKWKQEIAEKSTYFTLLLNTPFATAEPHVENHAGDFRLHYTTKRMPDAEGVPRSHEADIACSFAGTSVSDGKNTGSYTAVTADFSQLALIDTNFLKILFPQTKSEIFSKLSRSHAFNVECIADANQTVYAKSDGLFKILQDIGRIEHVPAADVGYVTMSQEDLPALLFGALNLTEVTKHKQNANTPWEVLERCIANDDMLYTGSVTMISELLTCYADLFADKYVTKTKIWDGSFHWQYKANTTVLTGAILKITKLSNEMAGTPLTEDALSSYQNALGKADVLLTMNTTVKNNRPVKTETYFYIYIREHLVPGTASATRSWAMEINTGKSYRDFDVKTDKPISIPKNSVPLATLQSAE